MKSLDGNETQMSIRTDKQRHRSTQYYLSVGWPAFKRSNNISEGDECVFRYITSEDKFCLGKVTHEKTPIRLPSPAEVVKRKRGRLPLATELKMTAAENVKMRSRRPPPVEITVAEAVKRKRGKPPPSSPRVAKDVKRKKGPAAERAREEMIKRELEISKSRPVGDEVRAEIADVVMMDLIRPDKPGQALGYGTGVTKSKVTKRIESQNNQIKTMAKDLSDIRGELNVLTTAFKELYLTGASKDMFFQETSEDRQQRQQGQATRQPTQLDSMGQQVNATNMQQNPLTGQQYGYSDMQQD
ncbi:DNA-binding pseudobarrel domain-containing protein [Tanacetum coccineum]